MCHEIVIKLLQIVAKYYVDYTTLKLVLPLTTCVLLQINISSSLIRDFFPKLPKFRNAKRFVGRG